MTAPGVANAFFATAITVCTTVCTAIARERARSAFLSIRSQRRSAVCAQVLQALDMMFACIVFDGNTRRNFFKICRILELEKVIMA